jgi:type II secretory ATPase GspE/PulE/Tfp pilus assembly ATPase PilB-like protein
LKASDKRIAARLVAAGELSPNDLESALSSFDGRVPLQDFLITKGYISAGMASRAVAEANGFQFVQLADVAPDSKALRMVGAEEAHRRQLLPAAIEDGTLTVIMSDPNDVYTQDELRLRLGVKIKTLIAESDDLQEALARHYGGNPSKPTYQPSAGPSGPISSDSTFSDTPEETDSQRTSGESHRDYQRWVRQVKSSEAIPVQGISRMDTRFDDSSQDDLLEVETKRRERGAYEPPQTNPDLDAVLSAEGDPARQFLKKLIDQAIEARVMEMELAPFDGSVRVRYRHLGNWEETEPYPHDFHEKIINFLRLMAGLELKTKLLATEHQFVLPSSKGEIICTLYLEMSAHGERAVVRFSENVPLLGDPLINIGLPKEIGAEINNRLKVSGGGLFFITSPSQRTVNYLYLSMLRNLAQTTQRDILSLERPHERNIPGVTSINCPNDEVLLASLANASFMQPDIIGVASVENGTVLNRVINVAIRGVSTIACFASPNSATSLNCIKAARTDAMNILRGVVGVLHVEEARKLCPRCSKPIENIASLPEWAREMEVPFNEAGSCDVCKWTGYRGTVFISEFFRPDAEAADGSFRAVFARDRDTVAASIAGEIDPRDYLF